MNADQLWETTMNPETRTLVRVKIEDDALAEKRVSTLMGDRVEPRRKWIEKTSNLRLKKTGACLILPLPHLRMGMLQAKKIRKLHKRVCHCSMTTWMKTFRNGRAIFDGNTFKYSGIIA